MPTQTAAIIIDLSASSNANYFDKKNFIHPNELDKVRNYVKKRLEELRKLEDHAGRKNVNTRQDAITILGSRGSGKTSFLKTLQHDLCAGEKDNGGIQDIEVIDIIDPTMIEQKGHVFLTIISQIRKKVRERFDADCNPDTHLFCERKQWDACLKKLAAGLPTLDGIGNEANMDAWQDPEYIMNKGLGKVDAAMNLAANFRSLVQMALKLLKKKAFVLIFDDVDIDFCVGSPVLETVRKYLICPEIITVVSGDMKLFSKAVRKKQWKNFGKALLKNEGELLGHLNSYNDLVTEMESQYMQKVLKPELRIRLTTLLEKYQADPKPSIEVNGRDLIEYYGEILSRYGIRNLYQQECYRSFLLNLPLRTQIQFLLKFIDDEQPVDIFEVFLSDLYEKEINIDFAVSMSKFINAIILKTLVDNKVLNDTYQMQPIILDASLNSSLMALSLLFSRRDMNNPFLVFDYFVRVGYIRNLLSELEYEGNRSENQIVNPSKPNRRTEMQSFSIEGLIAHAALYQDRNLRDSMCMVTAYLRAAMNDQRFRPYAGTVCLYGTAEKARQQDIDGNMRIDDLVKVAKIPDWCIALIPASISQSNTQQKSLVTYSVYALLGTITELLKICQRNRGNGMQEQTEAYSELEKALDAMSQLRTFPMPGLTPLGNSPMGLSSDENTGVMSATEESRKENGKLARKIQEWADSYPGKAISPHVLGKISTRAYYAMESIDSSSLSDNLGDYMYQRLIALMNAILVEDARENVSENLDLSNDNPRGNSRLFILNLNKVNQKPLDIQKMLSFSHWMLSCPLLLAFLKDDSDLVAALKDFGVKDVDLWIGEEPLYYGLCSVSVKDYTSNSTNPSKQTQQKKPSKQKRTWFYYSSKNMPKTLSVLKTIISYNDFMSADRSAVAEKCGQWFYGNIGVAMINAVQTYILNRNITW